MCCICSCFASVLDLIQRTITFVLACWLACVVCCGLVLASAAGIAYGYNYCMAEFMSSARSDVTVFLRRGKLYDDPELKYRPQVTRKRGGDAFDGDEHPTYPEFSANMKAEYEESQRNEPPAERRFLSEAWVKAEDTRKYAEWMTKYGNGARSSGRSLEGQVDTSAQSTIVPYMDFSTPTRTTTTLYQHVSRNELGFSSTQIHFRRFLPDAIGKWHRPLKPPEKSDEIYNLGYGDGIPNPREKDYSDIVNIADNKIWSTSSEGHMEDLYQDKIETPT